MIHQGLKPRWSDKRDYDFIKSHALGAFGAPSEYQDFSTDVFPSIDQNSIGLFYGCTGMSQGKLCSNEDHIQYDPAYIYDNTPPGGRTSGRDMRQSLSFCCKNPLRELVSQQIREGSERTGYFSIRSQGILDWFDAIYISLISTKNENRSASIGLPWFPEWQPPGYGDGRLGKDAILPIPYDFNVKRTTWHNAVIVGGKHIDGVYYLAIDSHQGTKYGDNGIVYMSKELCNAVFNINQTEVFTLSKVVKGQTQTIDLTIVEWIVSFIRNLVYGMVK